MDEYTLKKLNVRVHAHNEFKKLKDEVIKQLKPILKSFEGEELLKTDGQLKKKYYEPLNAKLEEIKKSFIVTPLKKGFWAKITHFYLSPTEYDLSLKISFNIQTDNPRNEHHSTPNEYKEFYVYLLRFEANEKDKEQYKWSYPINKKVCSCYELKEEEIINVEEQIKQAEKVQELKLQYELEKAKLQPYNIKELV